jgi:hypothetical protein
LAALISRQAVVELIVSTTTKAGLYGPLRTGCTHLPEGHPGQQRADGNPENKG